MATYKFRCENCGDFTIKMKMSEYKPLEKCPACEGKVKRVFEVPSAMIFKGEGFYITDYKKAKDKTKTTENSSDNTKKENKCKTCPNNNNS